MKWPKFGNQALYILLAVALLFAARGLFRGGGFGSLGTDTSQAIIATADIKSGGPPPQGIPGLGFSGSANGSVGPSPALQFDSVADAALWLEPREPVVIVEVANEARAYPLQILTWHEIANDIVAGVPVAVTFCPLCNSAFAFDLRVPLTDALLEAVLADHPQAPLVELDEAFLASYAEQHGESAAAKITTGLQVTFGTSGMLYNSNLIMFDSETSTLWPQVLAGGGVGTLAGVKLLRHPAQIVAFETFAAEHPSGRVLSRRTGFSRRYGANPYAGYDRVDSPPFLFRGPVDGRLPPKLRVITVELRGDVAAYPFDLLERERVVNDQIAGRPVAVFWQEGTRSALDQSAIASSKDIGAAGVYNRRLGGRTLTFSWDGTAFVDDETASRWNLSGRATSGELEGAKLRPVVHDNTLWFAWAAFKPETRVYSGDE
jgi:hypothetical protein